MRLLLWPGVFLSSVAAGPVLSPLHARDDITATVDLSVARGEPKHLGSGFIYGIPDTPNQIPDHWYEDIGFNYGRAGGAQLGSPSRGWIWNEYDGRLESTLSNYQTCRKYNAPFILLPHDVWGTDNANSSTVWPGDNGDWTDYENFVRQLMADLKAQDALQGLVWDIWNEPDISIFWQREQQQWIDLYTRTHQIIREDPDYDSVLISGPSLAFRPFPDNTWWTNWLDAVADQQTIPDQWSYHLEGDLDDTTNDLQNTNASLASLLQERGLPERQININEYAASQEQNPTTSVWWLSRLERYDAIGLRGNWLGGTALHDLFAELLTKENDRLDYAATDYAPAPEYQVYKYYNLNMTGVRAGTTGSTDREFDVYATIGEDKVRILAGVHLTTGTWSLTVNKLSAVGLPTEGTVTIQTWGFDGDSKAEVVESISDRGKVDHTYTGDSVTFPLYQTDNHTAFAFEFDI